MPGRSLLARAVVAISASRDVDRGMNPLPVGEREVLIMKIFIKDGENMRRLCKERSSRSRGIK